VEFTVTIDAVKMNSALGINTFDDIASALQKQFDALFGESGVFSVWLESKKFIPTEVLKAGGKGIMFLGGGVGYHSKSVLSSLAADPRKGNEFTKKILHVNFSRHKHFQDKPLSPRALKVAKVEGKDVFMGICRLKEVN
jgi:CRISPR-associated protein Csm5